MDGRPEPALLELILSRRSVREGYRDADVPTELLERVLDAGLSAPSSKNAQPWRLHVVTDRQALVAAAGWVGSARGAPGYVPHDSRAGSAGYSSTVAESAHVLAIAPAAIFIENLAPFSGGREKLAHLAPEHLSASLEAYTFEVIGLGAAIENMWLAARSLGLAAAFMGDVVVAEADISPWLDLVGDLVGVLVVGWSDGPVRRPQDDRPWPDLPRVTWHSSSPD